MPYAALSTPTGDISMHYNVLTPTSAFAKTIDRDVPTIVFIHGLYVAQEIFEPQASDPLLRKFNMVLMDLRAHGSTRGRMGNPCTPMQTADDVYRLMKYLNLPPCHVFGLSIGSCAALELAIAHPKQVLSLTLCSPLPPQEPEIAISGRQEIWDCWHEGLKDGPEIVLEDLVHEAVYGALQMIANNVSSPVVDAVAANVEKQLINNWAFTPEKRSDGYGAVSTWFNSRRVLTVDDLSIIRCPVQLIHCNEDLPYATRYVQQTLRDLEAAKVPATFHIIDGPHFGSLTNPEPVNRFLHDIIVANSDKPGATLPVSTTVPMMTPWHDDLARHGYYQDAGDESDIDFEVNTSRRAYTGSGSY